MTVVKPENSSDQLPTDKLLEALGNTSWRARKRAVERLSRENSAIVAQQVVEVLRDAHLDLSRLNAAIQILIRTEADIVPALLGMMADTSTVPDLRVYVALTLGERGDPRAIPALLHALTDEDTNVRVHAIEALGKLRASAAVDPLMGFIDSMEFEVAVPALDALMAIGEQRVAYRLLPLLQSSFFKTFAVDALGKLGDEDSIKPLWELLGNTTVPAGAIAKAIHQIHQRHLQLFGSGDDVSKLVQQLGKPENVLAFRSALTESSSAEVTAIVAVIGWIPGEEAEATLFDFLTMPIPSGEVIDALEKRGSEIVPRLLRCLEVAEIGRLPALIELCGRIGDDRCVPRLLDFVSHGEENVAAPALEALTNSSDARVYPIAIRLLGHPSTAVRHAAINAIYSLGQPETAADVGRLLRDPAPLVRESALELATHLKLTECFEQVLASCTDEDERVRRSAIEHLPVFEDARVLTFLSNALQFDTAPVRVAAAKAVSDVQEQIPAQLLNIALQDEDVWVRYYATQSLSRPEFRAEAADKLFAIALSDPAMQVRIAAIRSLGNFGEAAVPILIDLTKNGDRDFVYAALAALGTIGRREGLPSILAALDSDDSPTRFEAVRALAATNLAEAVEPLVQVAVGRDQKIADEAIVGLGRMNHPGKFDALLRIATIPTRQDAVVIAFTNIGEDAIANLACRLHSLPPDLRKVVIKVLCYVRSAAAIDVLETMLDDSEPTVRQTAMFVLSHLQRIKSTKYDVGGRGIR